MKLYFSLNHLHLTMDRWWTDDAYLMREVDDVREALYEIGRLFRSNGIKARGIEMKQFAREFTFGKNLFRQDFADERTSEIYKNCPECGKEIGGFCGPENDLCCCTPHGIYSCLECAKKRDDFDNAVYIYVSSNKYYLRFVLLTDDVVQKLKDAPKEYIVGETSPSIELLDNYFDDLKNRSGCV